MFKYGQTIKADTYYTLVNGEITKEQKVEE